MLPNPVALFDKENARWAGTSNRLAQQEMTAEQHKDVSQTQMAHLNMTQAKQKIEIKAAREHRCFSRTAGHLMALPPIELR
jgi:hypothetical protein